MTAVLNLSLLLLKGVGWLATDGRRLDVPRAVNKSVRERIACYLAMVIYFL